MVVNTKITKAYDPSEYMTDETKAMLEFLKSISFTQYSDFRPYNQSFHTVPKYLLTGVKSTLSPMEFYEATEGGNPHNFTSDEVDFNRLVYN